MLQSFLATNGVDNLLLILSIALTPSIIGILLAFYALRLPDESQR
jgi:hypothetical protein